MSAALHRSVRRRRLHRLAVNALICAFALFPILWGLSASLKSADRILEFPPQLIPDAPTLQHYVRLFGEGAAYYILNSVLVSALTVLVTLGLGALAAYALARYEFRGRAGLMGATVAIMSIPIASLLVPTFTLLSATGLTDTRTGLVLLYAAYQLPVVVWMLYGYFRSLPVEIENAARLDGCSPLRTLVKVVLPLSKPGLIAAGLFVLVFAWNDFVVAVTMTSTEAVRTFPVAIYFYLGFYGREWGPLLAASMVSIVPILLVFVLLQRHFMSGLTGGGVKG
ncbi:carbohydrate ABC transporter permease [Roseomonas sp. OT10]|uniref:carbohydrate ABC transporter permease n=1 Tax=Roseomonas cutis TaxID=2897332 RepID=UPI001E5401BE|nr:carbohydrate ABC transporter permease [Roseomonas sp. OT10]UFN47901.1 carbohydrate ABC transporter permease [Roseomonas sp. OT10]